MSLADFAESHGLKRVGARPPFLNYIKETWQRRGFAWTLSNFANEAQDAHTRLGSWWVVIQPTLQAGTYGLIFGFILGNSRPENFLPFLFIGVFFYNYIISCFQSGASSITGNAGLVNSLSFPRLLMPISVAIRKTINLWPPLIILLVLLPLRGCWPTLNWLLMIPVLAMMVMFSFGLTMIAARLNAQFRDLNNLIPFISRIGFYLSGVFFKLDAALASFPEQVQFVIRMNPFYDFIQLSRNLTIPGYTAHMTELWVMCAVWAVITPIFGTFYFWKAEERYGRD